jgi:hypothetical protein
VPVAGRLRKRLSDWASSSDQDARDLRRSLRDKSEVSIADAPDREPVTVSGRLRTVTLRPRGGVPALEAELYDGSAVLTVIWLGRRTISGIEPGRSMRVSGRIGVSESARVIYNPRYELLP